MGFTGTRQDPWLHSLGPQAPRARCGKAGMLPTAGTSEPRCRNLCTGGRGAPGGPAGQSRPGLASHSDHIIATCR